MTLLKGGIQKNCYILVGFSMDFRVFFADFERFSKDLGGFLK